MFPTETLFMVNTGKIIVLAYPDTFVKMSDEWICKLLPLVGLGTWDYIKAGHAAQVLVHPETGVLHYYDFGRYFTPKGFGRVRSAHTDAELTLPMKAQFDHSGTISNLSEILIWLEAHPEKTHGKGRLLASVCESIDFCAAKTFVTSLQQQGAIPYKAFHKKGSNCSRFVTNTLLAATFDKKIRKGLLFNKRFTPSTVGNVEKAATNAKIYKVKNGKIALYHGSAFKENLTNYFHRKTRQTSLFQALAHDIVAVFHKIEGIGSNAYFEIVQTDLPMGHFRIKKYNDFLEEDFDGVYFSEKFNFLNPYKFTYESHYAHCHVIQDEQKIKLERVSSFKEFNSLQKERSA